MPTKREIFDFLRDNHIKIDTSATFKQEVFNYVCLQTTYPDIVMLQQRIARFAVSLHNRWVGARYQYKTFVNKFEKWLETDINASRRRYYCKLKQKKRRNKENMPKTITENIQTQVPESPEITPPVEFTPEEALDFIIKYNLSKSQYIAIREAAVEHGTNIYPLYEQVQLLIKKTCSNEVEISHDTRWVKFKKFKLVCY